MIIATKRIAMRLIELITIYLATGAPFGVHYFLQKGAETKSGSKLLKAFGVMFSWPLITIFYLLAKNKKAIHDSKLSLDEEIEQARRALQAPLQTISEFARGHITKESGRLEELIFVIRDNAEKYTGLVCIANELDQNAKPLKHELEIFRVSEYQAKDLFISSQCLHRRNVKQLIKHRNRARADLIHALIEMHNVTNHINVLSLINPARSRQVSEALLRLYNNMIELLSLIEDQKAVVIVAKLRKEESDIFRELDAAIGNNDKQEVFGEERCLHKVRQPITQTSPHTTPTQS